ncbi:hypothetical protein [Amycolatopsis silviterrae]|uniref:Zinc-finger domain-containing protein n=1 Tax=Amycolatopsis silviterrae TaxID=1656914 RepID=A0ABW5HGD6_9PSEU
MTNGQCERVRGEIAELVMLGRPLDAELLRHVDGCAGCSRDLAEIQEVAGVFAAAEGASGPPDLGRRIEARVRVARGKRFVRRIGVVAAAAAVAAAVALGTGMLSGPAEPPPQVALIRDGSMVPRPWGTEVPIMLTGLRTGETYQFVTVGRGGRSIPAGSVHASDAGTVHTRMITAMSRDTITALLVRDADGQQVATVPVGQQG